MSARFVMGELCEGFSKTIISIHYPAVIENESKALDTLGGTHAISAAYSERNRRLELRMRPGDAFCKAAYGTRKPVVALLLKVKVKRKQSEVSSCEVVGKISEEYKFSGLCDFQFSAMFKDEILYDKTVPRGLDCKWFEEGAPLFLPPAIFSRIDTVQSFSFPKISTEEETLNSIGRSKRKRFGCTKLLTFDDQEVPVGPKDVPIGGICSAKIVNTDVMGKIKQLFQERPIYSKNAISCISKVASVQLKCILPYVAYYFKNGPWRALWVRFGYDPRKDPSARIYQTLDYRAKSSLSKDDIKNKRSYTGALLSHKLSGQPAKNSMVISRVPVESNDKDEKGIENSDIHIFKPGVVPPARQCYYQYCDFQVPKIQQILEKLDPVKEDAICDPVHGWMPPGTSEECRRIMNECVVEELKRRNVDPLSAEHSIQDSNSEPEPEFSDSE